MEFVLFCLYKKGSKYWYIGNDARGRRNSDKTDRQMTPQFSNQNNRNQSACHGRYVLYDAAYCRSYMQGLNTVKLDVLQT
jgi:hypothetical protein